MQLLLIELRKKAGESQKDIADLIGISEGSYRKREIGNLQFKMNEMFVIAKHYNKPIEDIFLPRKFTKSVLKEKRQPA
ncbi:helix-turn-helix domain-containing protein [Enterococcus faecalis]|uniref:helix-turn-helix transcriptional regulator n=1 Tax=Enterococcus faecalis TaxID=1351 RepID=UPI002DB85974|nr:helix-turn-helix transcriptional regulator [Enterococcus faecalis]MEB7428338.1 helix-turn-helix domain-containing protein [Enterococcus faecalis]